MFDPNLVIYVVTAFLCAAAATFGLFKVESKIGKFLVTLPVVLFGMLLGVNYESNKSNELVSAPKMAAEIKESTTIPVPKGCEIVNFTDEEGQPGLRLVCEEEQRMNDNVYKDCVQNLMPRESRYILQR